ncbi:hypothetical protein BDP27DRAFT_1437681 [Rhodocollybia butyracea]|uniref:DUF4136 domain-containing protein n=1 Tax=Rhodocollybia butyracea TaxID=206335 RepID=A0A9P5P567_9AGAR|nr:hypothetical protein BDP27DRAFT_1437681 [Rhodocollybia butyracea]
MLFTPRSLGFVGLLVALISSACAAPIQTSGTTAPESKSVKFTVIVLKADGNPVKNVGRAEMLRITNSLNAMAKELGYPARPTIIYEGVSNVHNSESPYFLNMVFYHVKMEGGDSPYQKEQGYGYVVTQHLYKFGSIVTGGDGEIHRVITQVTRPTTDTLPSEKAVVELQMAKYQEFVKNFVPVKAWHPAFPHVHVPLDADLAP